jgi:hypothetical protein
MSGPDAKAVPVEQYRDKFEIQVDGEYLTMANKIGDSRFGVALNGRYLIFPDLDSLLKNVELEIGDSDV